MVVSAYSSLQPHQRQSYRKAVIGSPRRLCRDGGPAAAAPKPAYRRRSFGRLALAVSATLSALFGPSRAFARGHHHGGGEGVEVTGVSAGAATVQQNGRETRITASSQNTVIDYSRFDLGRRQTADFVLPGRTSRILNRIDGATPSHIDGHVLSNGSVYFLNPAGVLFGPTAVIDVAGLYAAAAHMSNADFLAGVNHFTGVQGAVINRGMLKADVVAMVGREAANHGVILGAKTVTIVAGGDVLVGERFGNIFVKADPAQATPAATPANPFLSMGAGDMYSMAVVNTGSIQAPQVQVQAGAKNQGGAAQIAGHIDASNATGHGGSVTVTADTVALTGATLDASGKTGGGSILVGGDAHGAGALQNANTTSVDAASSFHADTTGGTGAGGKVVVWSDGATAFHGVITAKAGTQGGDGGFVETSGHVLDTTGGSVDASAPKGNAGVWLLDPAADLDIVATGTGDAGTILDTAGATLEKLEPLTDAITGKLDVKSITDALKAGTSVTVQTTDPTHTVGTITLTTDLSVKAGAATGGGHPVFTLESAKDVAINGKIDAVTPAGDKLDVVLDAPGGKVTVGKDILTNGGSVQITAAAGATGTVDVSAPVTTAGGSFTSTGGGAFTTAVGGKIDTTGAAANGAVTLNHAAVTIGDTINAGALSINNPTRAVSINAAITTNGADFLSTGGAGSSFTSTATGTIDTRGGATTAGGVTVSYPTVAIGGAIDAAVSPTVAGTVALTATNTDVFPAAAPLTIGAGVHAGTLNAISGGDLTVGGAAVTIAADAQLYQAGAGPANAAKADLITGLPVLVGTAGGATAPTSFSLEQGPTIDLTALPPITGLGTTAIKLTLHADAGDLTIPTVAAATAVAGSDLTLIGQNVTITPDLTALAGLHLQATGNVNVASTAITTTTQGQDFTGTVKFTAVTPVILTVPVGKLVSISAGATGGDLTIAGDASLGSLTLNSLEVKGNATVAGGSTIETTAAQTFDKTTTVTGGSGATAFKADTAALTFTGALTGTGFPVSVSGATVALTAGATADSLDVTGAATIGGNVTTTGDQVYHNDATVTVAGAAQLKAGGALTFDGKLTAATADLTAIGAPITFGGAVAAKSLDVQGLITVDGPTVTTTGNQKYENDVTLGGDVTFTATGAAAGVEFDGNVGGHFGLSAAVGAGGDATFKGAVGTNAAPLASAQVSGGLANLNGGGVFTDRTVGGSQQFLGGALLGTDSTLQGFSLAVGPATTLDANHHDLTLNFSSPLTIGTTSTVPLANLKDLTVGDGTGVKTILNGTVDTTGGTQTYNDPVTLAGALPVNLKATTVTFNNTINNDVALTPVGLTVTGDAALTKDLGVNTSLLGALDVTGNTTVSGPSLNIFAASAKFEHQLSDSGNTDLAIHATGLTTFGGAVTLKSVAVDAATEIDGGSVKTGGATLTAGGGQTYGGAVTLGAITALQGNALSAPSIDGTLVNHFNLSLTFAADPLTLGGATGVGIANVGTLTVGNGALETTGKTHLDGNVNALTAMIFNDAVSVDAASHLTVTGAAGTVAFNNMIGGTGGLTVDAGGGTTFHSNVNLGSLAVNTGLTTLDGGVPVAVTTTTGQSYLGGLNLIENTTLRGTTLALGALPPASQVQANGNDLSLIFSAPITIDGAALLNVNNLTVGDKVSPIATAATILTGGVTTIQSQTYVDPLTLKAAAITLKTTSASGAVTFDNTVNSDATIALGADLEAQTATTTFAQNLGAGQALGKVTADGATVVGTSGGAVEIDANRDVVFTGTLTSADTANGTNLTVNSHGQTKFGGAVNLGRLTVDATGTLGGTTLIAGGTVQTNGNNANQLYNNPVTIGVTAATLTAGQPTSASSDVTFAQTVTGLGLTINTQGTTSFFDAVTTASLTTDTGGVTSLGNPNVAIQRIGAGTVNTPGAQAYGDTLDLHANANLSAAGITFTGPVESVVDLGTGKYSLSVSAAGLTTLGNNVGLVASTGPKLTNELLGLSVAGGSVSVASPTIQVSGNLSLNAASGITLTGDAVIVAGGTIQFTQMDGGDAFKLSLTSGSPLNLTGTLATPVLGSNAVSHLDGLYVGPINAVAGSGADVHDANTVTLKGAIATDTFQHYGQGVLLDTTGPVQLTTNTGGGQDIAFATTVDGAAQLLLTSPTVSFFGPIGNGGRLTSLNVTAGTTNFWSPAVTGGDVPVNFGVVSILGQDPYAALTAQPVLTNGNQSFSGAVDLHGAAVSFDASAIGSATFTGPITATDPTALRVNAGAGVAFNGAVTVGSLVVGDLGYGGATAIDGGSVTTKGDTTHVADQLYFNPVTFGAQATLTAAHANDAGTPNASFNVSFRGNATSNTAGHVGATIDTTGSGAAGAKGHTVFGGIVDLGGSLTVLGDADPTMIQGGLVRTGDAQDLQAAVSIIPNFLLQPPPVAQVVATSGPFTVFESTRNDTVHFGKSVTAAGSVEVITGGDTTFTGAVNVSGDLATDGRSAASPGTTIVQGQLVQTGGLQEFRDDVSLAPTGTGQTPVLSLATPTSPLPLTVFVSTGDKDIAFRRALTGAGSAEVTTGNHLIALGTGQTTFGRGVDLTGDLTVDGGGKTIVAGRSVQTAGYQDYRDAVTVTPNTADAGVPAAPALTSFHSTGDKFVTFEQSLAGNDSATVTTGGAVTFGGAVNLTAGSGNNGSLSTAGNGGADSGTTTVQGRLILTDGSQNFTGDVVVAPNTAVTFGPTSDGTLLPAGSATLFKNTGVGGAQDITFKNTVSGVGNVTITTDAITTLGSDVTLTHTGAANGDLLINGNTAAAPGTTVVKGATVLTDGLQDFADDAVLASGAPENLFKSTGVTGAQPITFERTLTGTGSAHVTTDGDTTFGGMVYLDGHLTTDGNGGAGPNRTIVAGHLVQTTGTQDFADDVVAAPAVSLPTTVLAPAIAAPTDGSTLPGFPFTVFKSSPDNAVDFTQNDITFQRTLTGTSNVTVTTAGATTFGGVVILTSGPGVNADLLTNGGGSTVVQGGLVRTGGSQTFADAVNLDPQFATAPAVPLHNPQPTLPVTIFESTGDKDIAFARTVTGTGGADVTTGNHLVPAATGVTTFGGPVDIQGGLITDGGGKTVVAGGFVRTGGNQDYFDNVELAPDATFQPPAFTPSRPLPGQLTVFTSTGNLDITFEQSLTKTGSADVTTGGTTTFGGIVDITGGLLTDAGGNTVVKGGLVRTGDVQTFVDDVVLAPSLASQPPIVAPSKPTGSPLTVFVSTGDQNVTFERTLTGTGSADVTTGGASNGLTTFGGAVDITGDLLTDGGGNTVVKGGLVRTGGYQDFLDDVQLNPDAALQPPAVSPSIPLAGPVTVFTSTTNKDITFERSLTQTGSADVSTGGTTTFGGLVDITNDLLTDGGGKTVAAGRLVQTGGKQDFFDDVVAAPNNTWPTTGNVPVAGETFFNSTGDLSIHFERSLTGSSDVLVTTGGDTTFGGVVNLTAGDGGSGNLTTDGHAAGLAGATIVQGRLILTDGAQHYVDDVVVAPNASVTFSPISDGTPMPAGSLTLFKNTGVTGAHDITFDVTLSGTSDVTVTTDALTTFGGTVTLTHGAGINADLHVNGNTPSAPGTTIVKGGLVETDGLQDFADDVFLNTTQPQTLFHNTGVTGPQPITFERTLEGSGFAHVTTDGDTTLGGMVFITGNLKTDGNTAGAPGRTIVNGRLVQTTGTQDFADDVVVAPAAVLESTALAPSVATPPDGSALPDASTTVFKSSPDLADATQNAITFERSLTGTSNVTVTTAGDTTFGGEVILSAGPGIAGNLITNGNSSGNPGRTFVNGRLVSTAGFQQFFDDVIVNPDAANLLQEPQPTPALTLFTSTGNGEIHYFGSLTGNDSVQVTTSGDTTFGHFVTLVQGNGNDGSLITDGNGKTIVQGRLVLTDGSQLYHDDVVAQPDASAGGPSVPAFPLTLFQNSGTAGAKEIHFFRTLTGTSDVTVTTAGDTTFGEFVKLTAGPGISGNLITDGGGAGLTIVQGRLIQTDGFQHFFDAVQVAPNLADGVVAGMSPALTLFHSTGDNFIHFERSLTGSDTITVTTNGDTTFGGLVDLIAGNGNNGSLTTDGGGKTIVQGLLVRTDGSQLFRDDVTLDPNTALSNPQSPIEPIGSPVTIFKSNGNLDITFERSLTGTGSAEVNTGTAAGTTTFGGLVDITGDLVTDGGGKTIVAGRLVQTGGMQDFYDDVVVSPNPTWPQTGNVPPAGDTLFNSVGSQPITFEQSLTGTSNVTVTTGGMTTFKGTVNLVGSLTTDLHAGGDAGTTIGAPGVTGAGQVTTTSFQNYGDNVILGTDAHLTSTRSGDITFNGTVTGPHALETTTSGQAIFEAPVSIASLVTDGFGDPTSGSVLINGHGILPPLKIDTTAFQDYKNAVILGGDATLTSTGGSDPAGAITFEGTVSGPHNMIVNTGGTTTFMKTVDVGTLLTDAPGTTAVNGGIGSGFTIRTIGFQDFKDSVVLGAPALFISTAAGDVSFDQNLTGQSFSAEVRTAGITTFRGEVQVLSLTTDAGGHTVIGDGSVAGHGIINTGSFQLFGDDVVLGTDATLTAGGNVTFMQTVTGPQNLVVNTAGTTAFEGAVNIATLKTDAPGVTAIDGRTITTSGFQNYGDNVTLGNDALLTSTGAGDVTFHGTVTGPHALTANTAGVTTFDGAVNVATVETDAPGLTALDGGSVTTSGFQRYHDNVELGHGQTPPNGLDVLTAGADVLFDGNVTSANAGLEITVGGGSTLTFNQDVTILHLLVHAPGSTLINTSNIKTTAGGQDYENPVIFSKALTVTDTSGNNIIFAQTLSGAGLDFNVKTTGTGRFVGNVDVGSFTSDVGGTTEVHAGLKSGVAVTFNDLGFLTDNANVDSSNHAVTFNAGARLSKLAAVNAGSSTITFNNAKTTTTIDGTNVRLSANGGSATAAANRPAVDFENHVSVTGVGTVTTAGKFVKFAQAVDGGTLGGRSVGALTVNAGAGDVAFRAALGGKNGSLSQFDLTLMPTPGSRPTHASLGAAGNVTFDATTAVQTLKVLARNVVAHDIAANGDILLQPDPQLRFFQPVVPITGANASDPNANRNFLPFAPAAALTTSARARRAAAAGTTVIPGLPEAPQSPDGVLTLLGNLSAGGNISLAAASRSATKNGADAGAVVPASATIQMMQPGFTATSTTLEVGNANFTITAGGNFVMGNQEKLTVLGNLNLSAGGGSHGSKSAYAEISDVSTFRNLTVSAPNIAVNLRTPANDLDSAGRALVKDNGVDYFAGGNMLFDGHLLAFPGLNGVSSLGTGGDLAGLHAPSPQQVAFGITNGQIGGTAGIASYPFHMHIDKVVTVADFLFQGLPAAGTVAPIIPLAGGPVVLDATPDGPSATVIAGVLAQALPAQLPRPTEDENIGGAARRALQEMGIYARDLTDAEKIEKALGQVLYLEVPAPEKDQPQDYEIAAARIPQHVALDVLAARDRMFGNPPAGVDATEWQKKRRDEIKVAIADAFDAFMSTDNAEADPAAFRQYLETNHDKYHDLLDTFDRIRDAVRKAGEIGLTRAQLEFCQSTLTSGFVSDEVKAMGGADCVVKSIFIARDGTPMQPKAPEPHDNPSQRVAAAH